MIHIKLIPNILEESGRVSKEIEYRRDKTLADYLGESGFDFAGQRIIVSGKHIEDLTRLIDNGDEVIITPRIETGVGEALWAFGAWLATELMKHWFTYTFYSLLIGYSIYQTTRAKKSHGSTGGGAMDESSPTYGWDGIQTIQEVGVPVPIVYGRHRMSGNIINQYVWTDGDKNYLNALLLLCEGEISGVSEIEINDNPLENFRGYTTYVRTGANTQSIVPGFEDLHSVKNLGVTLTKDSPYTHTTESLEVEAFEVHLNCLNGLYSIDPNYGSVVSFYFTYKVEYKLHEAELYTDLGETTVSGRSRSAVRRVFRKDGLTPGQYDIRVTRTSIDSTLEPMQVGDLTLTAIDEITTDDLTYPARALLGIKLLGTDQLSGAVPKITSLIKGKLVSIPQVMNGETEVDWEDYYWDPAAAAWKLFSDGTALTWDGETYVSRWCANPAWCIKDLLINKRYGLGKYIETTHISTADFLEMARYCDERVDDGYGGYEKRFMLDVVIDSPGKALDTLMQLCATFRAMPFYSGDTIRVRIDKPETPVQMFGMGNIIQNSFSQSMKSYFEQNNMVEVTYTDKNKKYIDEQVVVVDDASLLTEPVRRAEVRLFCTRESQALREGKYALLVGKYINRAIKFRAAVDALACQAGNVINFSHDVPQWGYSGRVVTGSTVSDVVIDQALTLEPATTYKLRVRFADDTQEETTITSPAGVHTTLAVSPALSKAPAAFDLYAVGENDKVVKPFRIVSISRANNNECEISAIEYNAAVYDTDSITIPTSNYSALTSGILPVDDVKLTEGIIRLKDGTIENIIDVWWARPDDSERLYKWDRAAVFLSDDAGLSYRYVGASQGTVFTIQGGLKVGAAYYIKVCSVVANGLQEPIAGVTAKSITLTGKSTPPSDVASFIVRQSRDRLYLRWGSVGDGDLSGYEIRYGESWDAGAVIASNIKSNSHIELNFRIGESQSFFIKAMDNSGNYSSTAKEATVTIENIPFTNVIKETDEHASFSGDKTHTEVVGDNLELSSGYLTGTYETPVIDVGYVATFKIGIEEIVTAAGDTAFDDFTAETFDDMGTRRFSGEEVAGAASFEIKTSDDNVTWSAYTAWTAGDYKCRYYQIRMTLTRSDAGQTLQCSELTHYADLPDVDETGDDAVSSAGDGKAVTFTKTFHEIPAVNIDIVSGSGYVHKFSVVPSTTGFTVKLYDMAGSAVTGDFRYHAHGV